MQKKLAKLAVAGACVFGVTAGLAGPAAGDSLTVVKPSGQTPVSDQHVGMCFNACGPMSPYNQGAGDPGTVVTFGPAG